MAGSSPLSLCVKQRNLVAIVRDIIEIALSLRASQ